MASQPQTTCSHTSPGPPHPASTPPRSSRPATRTAAAIIGLHNQSISEQTRNHLREAHLHARRPHQGLDLTAVCCRNRLEWANAHIRWHLALWRGILFTDESRFSLYRADGRQHVWHCVGERFADVNVVDRVAHGGGGVIVWAGISYVTICYNEHRCIVLMAFWMHSDTMTRSWGPLLFHSSTIMIMHGPMLQGHTIPGSWKHPSSFLASILTRHVTHWACLGCSGLAYTTAPTSSSSYQYPATLHSHWKGVDQHSKGHNQQPDQLYVKEMCCTVWGKWWSHQILTGFRTPPPPIQ